MPADVAMFRPMPTVGPNRDHDSGVGRDRRLNRGGLAGAQVQV
jgi:hypothetical protein